MVRCGICNSLHILDSLLLKVFPLIRFPLCSNKYVPDVFSSNIWFNVSSAVEDMIKSRLPASVLACLRNYSNNRQIGKRNLFHVSSTTRREPTLQTQKYPWRTGKCHCRVLQGSTGRNLYWWCFLWMDKSQTGFRRDTESVLWQIRERLQKIFPLHFCFNYQKEI